MHRYRGNEPILWIHCIKLWCTFQSMCQSNRQKWHWYSKRKISTKGWFDFLSRFTTFKTKRNYVSLSGYVTPIYYINLNEIPNHYTFTAKGTIFYVTIATAIFSCMKITCCFRMWWYHAFAQKITWYLIGVYMINFNILKLNLENPLQLTPKIILY